MTDWNLISGPSDAVLFDNIDDPDGLIIPGTVYGFGNGYEQTDIFEPGKGYWVRSTGNGSVNIGAARSGKTTNPLASKLDNTNSISVNDAELYFGVNIPEEDKLSFSLPPKPPAGGFDIRFSGDLKVAHDMGVIEIMNSSEIIHISYNVVDKNNWILHDPLTQKDHVLSESGEIQIAGNSEALFLSKSNKDVVPNAFVLHSAFPNPFNPSTQISYYLSKETHVDISVYDIAGRLTETLVNDLKDRGSHAIIWNASNQSSGVYFIKITADDFSDAQKVILTK